MAKGTTYYVVWTGKEPGIYTSWESCEAQVKGVAGAKYKSFKDKKEAAAAFVEGELSQSEAKPSAAEREETAARPLPTDAFELPAELQAGITAAVAVDAACSGNPGKMEYRGIDLAARKELFHFGPAFGTNNIGEFLAIVHALALLKQSGRTDVIFSDSRIALGWVVQKKCKTKLPCNSKSEKTLLLVERAEKWLQENTYPNRLLKWKTEEWGEIPADFGRKSTLAKGTERNPKQTKITKKKSK